MRTLEARFFHDRGKWFIQLALEGERPRAPREWRDPAEHGDLFWSLFEPNEDHDLIQGPFRLLIRPRDIEPRLGLLPDVPCWANLYHPDDGFHLLDRGWTMAEMTAWPKKGESSGAVAVLGDEPFTRALQRSLGPRVRRCASTALPHRSLVVVQARLSDEQALEIQAAAQRSASPLIIWCETQPPRGRVADVIHVAPSIEPSTAWLDRFLSRLVRGVGPEQAFAEAGLDGPPEDRRARWLRGAFSSWHVRPADAPNSIELPREWFIKLDRSAQEAQVNLLADYLLVAGTKRRVQVIISPGEEKAGLVHFRRRPPRVNPDILIERDLGWTDDPTCAEQSLLWGFHVRRRVDIPEALLVKANELRSRLPHLIGKPVLFWTRMETLSLEPGREAKLRRFLSFLRGLSVDMVTIDVRLLVHISIQGATQQRLLPLEEKKDPFYRADVLPALGRVPDSELQDWLGIVGLEYTDEDLAEMRALDYDDLVQWLVHRYPELPVL